MAKKKMGVSFTKATIEFADNEVTITEISKDSTNEYGSYGSA